MTSKFLQRGGAWVVAQFGLMAGVLLVAVWCPGDGTQRGMTVVGVALLVVSGGIGLAGIRALGQARTPFPMPKEHSQLIQRGIYARVRHPLYSAVMLLSVGWAMSWQSWPALLVALVQIPFFMAKARREERWLREKHPGYAEYAKRVPPFIPRCAARCR